MAILNASALRSRAAELDRENRRSNRLLVLIYLGVTAVLTLGSSGLNLLLDSRIGQTGGLDGLGLRAILQTVQEVVYYVNYFFGPFWSAGFTWAIMTLVREGQTRPMDLTAGFRRFGRVLGHMAFEFMMIFALTVAAANLATILYSMTESGAQMQALMAQAVSDPNLLDASGAVNLDVLPMAELTRLAMPMLVLCLVIEVPVYLYLAMCYRMSMYLVMDLPIGGVRAHFLSMQLMRGHKRQMLKLDLRYWYYYLLSLLVAAVAYMDQLLPMLGISLPVNGNAMYFLSMGCYYLLSLGLFQWKKCEVDGAHILAFEAIAHPEKTAQTVEA